LSFGSEEWGIGTKSLREGNRTALTYERETKPVLK
jgi:hypothetical protein